MQKFMILPRLIAGLPLLILGAKHFVDPGHFRKILEITDTPMVEINMIAAPVAECTAGLLLLLGLFSRVGGLLGIATMVPAIIATIKIMGIEGTDKPFVPPLPIPIVVLLCSALVLAMGGGRFSVDANRSRTPPTNG